MPRMSVDIQHFAHSSTRFFFFLSCCVLLLSPALLSAQSPGRRPYLAAENLRKQNKCRDAILQYDEAIKLEPTNYKYHFQRGKCEYQLKNFEMAKNSFKATVEYKKNFTPAYSLLAKMYKNEKDYDNAVYYYEEAARYESNPSRQVQYKLLLVNLLLKEDRILDASRHVDEASRIDPSNPKILFYKGEIAQMREDWNEARRAYEQALGSERLKESSPAEKAKYYYGLGLALNKQGDSAGAKKAWSKANFGPYQKLISQQMAKNNHVYFYKIAVSYYLNGEFKESESYIDKTLAMQRDFSSAYVLKGKIAKKQGNLSQAITHYKRAIELEKNSSKQATMYLLIANLYLNSNDHYNALRTVETAVAAESRMANNPKLLYMQAQAEYGSAKYSAVLSTLEKLLKSDVDTKARAKYSFMMGMAAKRTGDLAKAQEGFKAAMYGPYKPAAQTELEKLREKG